MNALLLHNMTAGQVIEIQANRLSLFALVVVLWLELVHGYVAELEIIWIIAFNAIQRYELCPIPPRLVRTCCPHLRANHQELFVGLSAVQIRILRQLYQVWLVEKIVHCTFIRGSMGLRSVCCEEVRWSYFACFGVRACQGLGISSVSKRC